MASMDDATLALLETIELPNRMLRIASFSRREHVPVSGAM
jgi:hypothetical protein